VFRCPAACQPLNHPVQAQPEAALQPAMCAAPVSRRTARGSLQRCRAAAAPPTQDPPSPRRRQKAAYPPAEVVAQLPTEAPTDVLYDAVIIGSGMGGLATASQLVAKGARVLVLEK
jgi:hypothetical protein